MRRPAIVTFVLENLGWMIGSLILAVFIWIAATTEQNPVEARRFPQRIPIQIALDEGMTITNTPTRTGQVFLRTQASVWEVLEADDITMRADLTGYAPGTYTIELTVRVATARRVVVEDWQPRQITVSIDRAGEILAEVTADVRSQPPTGFEITEITFDPPEVRVTGPASQVQRVTSASARLNLRDDRNPFTREIQLAPVDDQGRIVSGVTLTPDTVSVSGNIQPREDYREVFVTPNITGDLPEGYVIHSITYEPQTILVSGRPSALEQLPGTIATAPVDLTGQTTSFSRNVQVELPPGVFLPTEQTVTVTVNIDALPGSRRFEGLPVQVQGLASSLEATITPSQVTLLVTGPQPILNMLTPADISILADLTNLGPGHQQIPVEPIFNREGLETAVVSVLPASLDVEIRLRASATPTPPALTPTAAPPGM